MSRVFNLRMIHWLKLFVDVFLFEIAEENTE